MKRTKIVLTMALVFILICGFVPMVRNTLYARYDEGTGFDQDTGEGMGWIDDIFGQGNDFFNPSNGEEHGSNIGTTISNFIKESFMEPIIFIGNLIFYAVAAILGVKYIWSGVDGKTKIKESLPTYLVAFVLFYFGRVVYDFFFGTFKTLLSPGTTLELLGTNIWGTVSLIINILAISGIIAVGLKYMYSPSNAKANIKQALGPVVIGIILVYSVNNVLNFFYNTTRQVLPDNQSVSQNIQNISTE